MRQKVASAYELLEDRLGISIRLLGVTMFLMLRLVWMSLLIYLTAKAIAIMIGVGTVMLLNANVWLGLLSLSFVPFVGWRSAVVRLRLRWMWLVMQERLSVLTRSMEENLTGIRVVRAFSAGPHSWLR